jgi:AcrR family transcriptional regulator
VAVRPYARSRSDGADSSATETRVLAAAEKLIDAGTFHQATVAELAEHAGVARATVFGRFGSKLGVLTALSVRCSGGPEIRGIRDAIALEDPRAAVPALVAASAQLWERQGHILLTAKAVVELEPGAMRIIDEQRADQRSSLEGLVARLASAGALHGDAATTVAMLHMITSVESFVELRRHGGLSFDATVSALQELA